MYAVPNLCADEQYLIVDVALAHRVDFLPWVACIALAFRADFQYRIVNAALHHRAGPLPRDMRAALTLRTSLPHRLVDQAPSEARQAYRVICKTRLGALKESEAEEVSVSEARELQRPGAKGDLSAGMQINCEVCRVPMADTYANSLPRFQYSDFPLWDTCNAPASCTCFRYQILDTALPHRAGLPPRVRCTALALRVGLLQRCLKAVLRITYFASTCEDLCQW